MQPRATTLIYLCRSTLLLAVSSCIANEVKVDGRPCPCPDSHRCCETLNTCIPWEEACPRCGNAVVDPDEVCDDGRASGDDWSIDPRCNSTCSGWAPHCGDGELNSKHEECEPRAANGDCTRTCTAATVKQLAAGGSHTCALLETGAVKCWGGSGIGQHGGNNQGLPLDVFGLASGVQKVVAGKAHSCALMNTGSVKCWGSNRDGQLGGDVLGTRLRPIEVTGLDSRVTALAAGGSHTCALLKTGEVRCWGSGRYGQLGHGVTTERSPIPVAVSGLESKAVHIVATSSATCALLDTGEVVCWGYRHDGTGGYDLTPTRINGLPGTVVDMEAGSATICVRLEQTGSPHSRMACWGSDAYGALGDGPTSSTGRTPVTPLGLDRGVDAIAAGGSHTCALHKDGRLLCWGDDAEGQLGNGGVSPQLDSPGYVAGLDVAIDSIVAGGSHTCALLQSGAVQCWGSDEWGQIGVGVPETRLRTEAELVVGLAPQLAGLATGGEHTCAFIRTPYRNDLMCWGQDQFGQLGNDIFSRRGVGIPVAVPLTGSGAQVEGGEWHTCALLKYTGTVHCWGRDNNGELGNGPDRAQTVPGAAVDLSGPATVIASGYSHVCALLDSGSVMCWGRGNNGQLGNGSYTTPQHLPSKVIGLHGEIAGVAAGSAHTCAWTQAGNVQCWGNDSLGQLGDGGDLVNQPIPVSVEGLSGPVERVEAGAFHTCAILAGSGAIECWGNYGIGGFSSVPVGMTGFDAPAVALACGLGHTCAILNTGAVKCWGSDDRGQLGDGSNTDAYGTDEPVTVQGLDHRATSIDAGKRHTCARMENGAVACWGDDHFGQLGLGVRLFKPMPTPVLGLP